MLPASWGGTNLHLPQILRVSPIPEVKPHSCPCSFLQGGGHRNRAPRGAGGHDSDHTRCSKRSISIPPPDPVLGVVPGLPHPRSWSVVWDSPPQPLTAEAPPRCPPWARPDA